MELLLQPPAVRMSEVAVVARPNRLQTAEIGRRGTGDIAMDMGHGPIGKRGFRMRDDATAHERVRRTDDVAEEVDAVVERLEALVIFQAQMQHVAQEALDGDSPFFELLAAFVHEHEIVDVAQVSLATQGVLDELVEFVEQDVREELR